MSEFEPEPLHRVIFYHAFSVKILMQLDPGVSRETRLPLATVFNAFGVKPTTTALVDQTGRSDKILVRFV